jgi:hypothetical protein
VTQLESSNERCLFLDLNLMRKPFIPEGFQPLAGGNRSATTGNAHTTPTLPGGMQEGADSGIPLGFVS